MFEAQMAYFRNRAEAGRALASKLAGYTDRPEVVVLALPRGGVPVATMAISIHAIRDIFTVRKLGVPGREELAMGAVATGKKHGNKPPEPIPYRTLDLTQEWERFDIHHDLTTRGVERFVADYKSTLKKSD
jgi:predicted phosphoribosyltransferase